MTDTLNSELSDLSRKVVIIGDVFVGKTCLLLRFRVDIFNEDVKSTLGYDNYEKTVILENGKCVKLWLWDTAGSERFRGTVSLYYKNAKAVIVVFDLTNRSSFEKVSYWKDEIENYSESNTAVYLVGNKRDLASERKILKEEAQGLAKQLGFDMYFETSAKDNKGQEIQKLFTKVASQIEERPVDTLTHISDKKSLSSRVAVSKGKSQKVEKSQPARRSRCGC